VSPPSGDEDIIAASLSSAVASGSESTRQQLVRGPSPAQSQLRYHTGTDNTVRRNISARLECQQQVSHTCLHILQTDGSGSVQQAPDL
jgi:hypothetical protein